MKRFAVMQKTLATMLAISSCFLSICCASQDVLDDEELPPEPCPPGITLLAPAPDAEVPPPRDYQVRRSGCASVVNTTSRATASSGAKIR